MKNIISYYYNLHPFEVYKKNSNYFFEYLDNNYVFEAIDIPITDIYSLYNLNEDIIKRDVLTNKMILNCENNIITYVNNLPYVLMQIDINKDVKLNLSEICFFNNSCSNINTDEIIMRNNWSDLWESKNDYIESQINEIGKKYPDVCNYANYYIGMCENAISYVKEIYNLKGDVLFSVCHKRLNNNDTFLNLYNPLNYVYDYRIRDACEYIKSSFFEGENAYNLIKEYFSNNYITYKEALLFYARLLYPSYFFDVYDDFVNNKSDKKRIYEIVNKSVYYEKFLFDVYIYLSNIYNRYIPSVDWIIKQGFN